MTRHPELLNSGWLTEQYSDKQKSMEQIARDLSCSASLVRKHLLLHEIAIRDRGAAQRIRYGKDDGFSPDDSVITGCLLGDASLIIGNKTSEVCLPYFKKTNVNLDHVQYVSRLLFSGRTDRVSEASKHLSTGSPYAYSISSLTHESLLPTFKKWYPATRGYVKVIPEDIEVDATMLLHWFLDDGTVKIMDLKRGRRAIIKFCSECFDRDEQELLCEKINRKYDLHSKTGVHESGKAYRIFIPQRYATEFYDIIGGCPVPSMEHKWCLEGHEWDAKETFGNLDSKAVSEIKKLLEGGYSQRRIAEQFGVSQATVSLINTGKTWAGLASS